MVVAVSHITCNNRVSVKCGHIGQLDIFQYKIQNYDYIFLHQNYDYIQNYDY